MVIFLVSAHAAVDRIDCNMELKGQEAIAYITMYLSSDVPANYFSVEIPFQSARLIRISDSIGEIKDYSIKDNVLSIKTNQTAKRKSEFITIEAIYSNLEKEEFLQARIFEFSLPAAEDTNVTFYAYGPIYGFDTLAAFRGSIKDGWLYLKGKGPLYVRFVSSNTGKRYGRFVVFDNNIFSEEYLKAIFDSVEQYYFFVINFLGVEAEQELFAIVILDDFDYERLVNDYSKGIYIYGGLIAVKKSALDKKSNAVPVIVHELTHFLNSKVFSWNTSKAVWLDEGLAKFVEFLTAKSIGLRTPNLFYGKQTYAEGRYEYTIMPVSDFNELVNYYEKGLDYMAEWNASDPKTRAFGYAFSELFVRDYIRKNGLSSLHLAMHKFVEERENVSDAKIFTSKVLGILGAELAPCKDKNKEAMLNCVKELNEFEPKVQTAQVLKLGPRQEKITHDFDVSVLRANNMKFKIEELHTKFLQYIVKTLEITKRLAE
ncbi:MAG: hypothetical protein QXM75_01280 [Candidatus Diapherotrites archaeon]